MHDSSEKAAEEVGLLLDHRHKVSRNVRLKWYLDHMFQPVPEKLSNQDFIFNDDSSASAIHVVSAKPSTPSNLVIAPHTRLTFVSSAYKFVFGLDLSASMLRVDTLEHYVVIEAIITVLEKCLLSLVESYFIFDCVELNPDIYVTIFVQWHGTKHAADRFYSVTNVIQKVLVQGCQLTQNSVNHILSGVRNCIYSCLLLQNHEKPQMALPKNDDILLGILRTALLALRVLPPNRSSCIVIVTDGMLGEPSATSLERLLMQCHKVTASCSFIHVSSSANPLHDFGCISNVELMKFVAHSTKGKYINALNLLAQPISSSCTYFQEQLLIWSFHSIQQEKTESSYFRDSSWSCSAFDVRTAFLKEIDQPTLIRQKQDDKNLRADFLTVVSSRMRQGYTVKYTKIHKNTIEMCLELLWWKNYTVVEYKVSSLWPLTSNSCKVEVYICGTYEFLLDVSKRDESSQWTRARKSILNRFLVFFQNLMQSDHMLQYLCSFADNQAKYYISDSLSKGQTLYYLPPNSTEYVLSNQSQHVPAAFSSYWKPILSLDVSVWHQWLHIHKIEAILQHDTPLPSDLHAASSSQRYHSVLCRMASSKVVKRLREWCSFVLLENHAYVKFIYTDPNHDKPCSFFLVRLFCKSPAMVLKVAFLIGLPGNVRKHYTEELRELIVNLDSSGSATSSVKRTRHTSAKLSPSIKLHRSQQSASEAPCAVLIHKSLDQFLVRYSQAPENYLLLNIVNEAKIRSKVEVNDQHVRMRDMHWYLQHNRCVWSLTNTTSTYLILDVACHLASLLLKIRMLEGFRITYSSSGIVNLAREFPMVVSEVDGEDVVEYCLVQYILFPPKFLQEDGANSSSSLDSDEDNDMIDIKEILFATEVWVEPQHGTVKHSMQFMSSADILDSSEISDQFKFDSTNEVAHYGGLSCDGFISHINERDYACISNIITLEHLQKMCVAKSDDEKLTFPQRPESQASTSYGSHINSGLNENLSGRAFPKISDKTTNLQYYACVFDLALLLDNSPRFKHLFLALAENESSDHESNEVLFETFHKCLASHCNCFVDMSSRDQELVTKHMVNKNGNSKLSHCSTVNDKQKYCSSDYAWSCYLKIGENGQIFVILLPSTYKAFLSFSDSYEETNVSDSLDIQFTQSEISGSDGESIASKFVESLSVEDKNNRLSDKLQRRLSFRRHTSTNSNSAKSPQKNVTFKNFQQKTFCVYVYDCSMKMLVSSLLHGAAFSERLKWSDSLQDHRVFAEVEPSHYAMPPSFGNETPKQASSAFGFTEISDYAVPLQPTGTNHLMLLNNCIVELYHKAFVKGVFFSVQSENLFFSMDDLHMATDYFCQESVNEIDITDFLFLNCPEIVEFKSSKIKPSIPSDIDIQESNASSDCDIEDFCQSQPPKGSKESVNEKDGSYDMAVAAEVENDSVDSSNRSSGDNHYDETANAKNVRTPLKPTVNNISSYEKSAFTSVYRGKHFSSVEIDIASDRTTSSEEPYPSYEYSLAEVKGTTLPVKHVVQRKKIANVQTGWSNLPEFSISSFEVSHSRHFSGSTEQVERHFHGMLQAHCKSVPNDPYLFYAISNVAPMPKISTVDENLKGIDSDEEVQFICDKEWAKQQSVLNDNENSNTFILTQPVEPPATFSKSDRNSELSEAVEDTDPLFLYMSCTVRNTGTGYCGTVPVKCLPLLLKNVLDSLEIPFSSFHLSSLKITLDLIWIHLPFSANAENVTSVPESRLTLVHDIEKEIRWLLEDEIVSALRTLEPITISTLDRVAEHVGSTTSFNSRSKSVPMQFIFGNDKSKPLLHSEFEKFRMDNYKLKKVDLYYYLSLEQAFLPITDFLYLGKSATSSACNEDEKSYMQLPLSMGVEKSIDNGLVENDFAVSVGDGQPLVSFKNERSTSNANQQSISMFGLAATDNVEEKRDKTMKKASSSTELVMGSDNYVRRCTSATSMSVINSSLVKDNSLSKAEMSSGLSQLVDHQTLRSSTSVGKDPNSSSTTTTREHVLSMPATPLSMTNTEKFVFPPGILAPKQSISFSALSPGSGSSPRQYSQTSWLGSGYEGEESDCGEELDYRNSLQEAYSQLPNFWLIVKIESDCALIYFHRRSSAKVLPAVEKRHLDIFELVAANLERSCVAVNQTLLLKKLHDSRWCHPLLVEEPPEEIWRNVDYSRICYQSDAVEDQASDDIGGTLRASSSSDYLAAIMDFPPGHFECKCVHNQYIALHHRITVSKSSGGDTVPSALTTVKSFMKNFTVINQKNMFVFQVQDGTVYYCKMLEESKRPDTGRKSSHGSEMVTSLKDMSMRQDDPKLHLKWFGVHDLTAQHLNDLTELQTGIERKLDDKVLEYITLMLCRNLHFKLTPADISLIQPRESDANGILKPRPPESTVFFHLPSQLCSTMSALLYYIHQHLLQFLAIPRYSDPTLAQFLSCNSSKLSEGETEKVTSPPVYLYTELIEKGKKGHGIACICVDNAKSKKNKEESCKFDENITCDFLKKLTEIDVVDDLTAVDRSYTVIEMYIWICGSLSIADLHNKLKVAVRHALCDAVMEHFLKTPFSLQVGIKTDAMKTLSYGSAKDDTSFLQTWFPSLRSSAQSPPTKKDPQFYELSSSCSLHSFYSKVMPLWLKYMVDTSSPSITFSSIKCPGKLNVDQVVNDVCKILSSKLTDSEVSKFGKILNSNEDWKFTGTANSSSLTPGRYLEFILLARNPNLWQKAVRITGNLPELTTSTVMLQKFPPYDVKLKTEASPCPQHDMMMSSSYIPRQHFAFVYVSNESVEVYLYNMAHDKTNKVLQLLKQCTKFHHARLNMLQGLTFQKLGLFQHFPTKNSAENNLAHYSVDCLTRHIEFPASEKSKQRFTVIDRCFDDVLLTFPFHENISATSKMKDKAALFGHQCFIRSKQKKATKDAQAHLRSLCRKPSGSTFSVNHSILSTIFASARLFYVVSSPILLDNTNRQNYVAFFESSKIKRQKSDKSDYSRQSTALTRRSSFLGSYRRKSGDSLHKMPEKSDVRFKDPKNEFWRESFEFMSDKFAELFSERWKSFIKLEISDQASLQKQASSVYYASKVDHYLYRYISGGIILLAFSVEWDCFQVKLYSIPATLFSDQVSSYRQKTHSNFINECEKIKRNLDVHHTALEVHLHYFHWHLNGVHSVSRSKCNLHDLLQSYVICYSSLLDTTRFQIYHDTVSHACTQVSCQDLYQFVFKNAYAFRFKCCGQQNSLDINENVLFTDQSSELHTDECNLAMHRKCNVLLIVFKDNQEANILKLYYYLLFTYDRMKGSSSEAVPKRSSHLFVEASESLGRKLSESSWNLPFISQLTKLTAPLQADDQDSVSASDDSVPPHVLCEKIQVENSLKELTYTATMECYRSCYLWKKLLQMCQEKNYGKSLAYAEFCTLLEMMQVAPASEYNSKISLLFKRRNSAKQDQFLLKRLQKKFSKSSTFITSPDNSLQHVCILSSRDVHVMIVVKTNSQTHDMTILTVKPLVEHYIFHDDLPEPSCKELLSKVCNVLTTSIWMSWL